ncbi:MAG: transglutaminase family protein [Litoreibacter sp.]|nr:transglutaminase family protein [Litoreibacter sp.]
MKLQIHHRTQYDYDAPVGYALQKVRLRPQRSIMQEVVDWELRVDGGQVEASYQDHYGNHVDLVSAEIGVRQLVITAKGTVKTHDAAGVLGRVYGRAPLWHFVQPTPLTVADDKIKALSGIIRESDTVLNGMHALSSAVLRAVPYEVGQTQATTSAVEAVAIGKGVCQDHANIFIAAARAAAIPARYVSGYLMMDDRVDQDASHAWAEVHLEGLGWVGFDVSNGVSPDERYVRIATGRDAGDDAPISGFRMGASDESLVVSLQVQQ